MTSWQHQHWLNWGLEWQLARPLAALERRLRSYGYVTGDIGDPRHMDAEPPEDHTPYSETGWPIKTPYTWVTALDVLEPDPAAGLPTLGELAGQIYADMLAGDPAVEWLKYMNWEPEGAGGPCYHDSWQPAHVRRDSTDRGHVHLSQRSDRINSAAGDDYDPVARLRAGALPLLGDQMLYTITDGTKGKTVGKDALGNSIVHESRCIATPAGPVALPYATIIDAYKAYPKAFLPISLKDLGAICTALAGPAPAAPSK